MAVNKVVLNTENGEETLIDLTSDSVTPETLAEGTVSHDASGKEVVGILPVVSPNNFVLKNQGAANVGKILVVGTDGNLTLADMPEVGDVSGYVDDNNNIVLTGNLAEGTYSIKYELADGSTVDIGNLVLDNTVYYTVTNTLTNCVSDNSATEAIGGESYSATITANSGYELKSVTVTMGGSPVNVSGGVINIAEVTGDIVITAVAEEIKASYTNYAQPIEIGRIRGTGAVDSSASAARATAYIPVANGDTVRVKGLDLSSYNMGTYKDANGTVASWGCALLSAYTSYLNYSLDGDIYTISLTNFNDTLKYVRFSGTLMSGYTEDDVIVTVNEPIS